MIESVHKKEIANGAVHFVVNTTDKSPPYGFYNSNTITVFGECDGGNIGQEIQLDIENVGDYMRYESTDKDQICVLYVPKKWFL